MKKLMNILKKYWIGLMLVFIIGGVSLGYVAYVSADSTFTFSIELPFGNFSSSDTPIPARYSYISGFPTDFTFDGEQMTWKAQDEMGYPVFKFTDDDANGGEIHLESIGAGVSRLYAEYHDFYYFDEDGHKVDTVTENTEEVNATSSNTLTVRVPLEMRALLNGATTLAADDSMTMGETLLVLYNGYIRKDTVSGTDYYYNDVHPVVFTYNTNVLSSVNTVTSTQTSTTFTAIGGGSTTISASVDTEVTAEIQEKIYVGVEFKISDLLLKQNEIYTLSNTSTNILDGNFGTDENGEHSVFFWTYEDYQAEVLGITDTVPVVEVSDTGVITGKYAGTTTLYASCRPLAESYNAGGSLNTDVASAIQVTVPFETYFEDSVIVSVGDNIPILTSAFTDNTIYTMYNNNGVIDQTNTKGVYTAIAAGTATVQVTAGYYVNGIRQETAPVDVLITVIDKLTLSKDSDSVNIGSTTTVTAVPTCTDTDICSNVWWTSSDETIARVSCDESSFAGTLNATITGVSKGTVTISCLQTVNGVVKIATMQITVTVPVDGISLSEPSNGNDHLTLYLGQTHTIYAYLEYSNNDVPDNTEVTWTVSGDQILSLNPTDTDGVTQACEITATGLGQTTVTVYSADSNQIVTCDVFVTEQPLSISLSHTNVVAYMSLAQFQMKAAVESANGGADQTVIWTSLDPTVCTVDERTGLVTFVKPGTTYICATSAVDSSVTAYCYFEVAQDVYGIILDATSLTFNVGDTYRLTASVNPDNAYDKTMVWTSSNPEVVSVENTTSYENLLTATGSGSATIFAETNDGGYIAYCNIRVLQPVTGITLSNTEMTVRKGMEFYLNAAALPDTADDKTIVWSTNDASIATVSADGRVTTLSVGQCTITATNPASGVSASCVVSVLEPVTGLTLNTYYQNMVKGTRFVIIPTVEPLTASNKAVSYWSSDQSVATVDENGIVIAVNGGVCEIVVTTAESNISATCTIAVKEYVSSIELSDEFKYLNYGDTYVLSAAVGADTASDKNLIWSSSNGGVVTVTDRGVIQGVGYGTAVITATAADGSGVSDSCIIQVIRPVSLITLDKSKVTMYVGDVIHITATVTPADASVTRLQWTSSDPSIARVYDDGDVEAVSVGRCKIYATSTDGNDVVAECTIIVQQIVQASTVTINSDEILMLTGKTRKLTARLYPLNSSETVKWLSTDTSVVVVDENGQITTVGPGDCEVIAYTTYGTVEDRCIVYSMAISKSSLELEQYDTFNLYVDGSPSGASWRSSNPRIATVTQGGVVTGRMPGSCTISATVDGKTVTCYVRVTEVDPDKFINKTIE